MIQHVSFRDWHHYWCSGVVRLLHIDTHYLYLFPRAIAVYEISGVCVSVCASAGSSPSACHLSGLVVVHCNDITPFWEQTAVPWGGPKGHDLSHCSSTLPRTPEEQPSRGHPVRLAWELEQIPENEGFPSGAPLPSLTSLLWPDHSSVCRRGSLLKHTSLYWICCDCRQLMVHDVKSEVVWFEEVMW